MPDLQTTWFVLVGVLLAGYAILDGFDLGVGMLHLVIARDDRERRVMLNSIGPVWDGNEVWLLTGGGALFAAFPAVYATVFSGLYLAVMLLLFGLMLRAVSLEFRSKEDSAAWRRWWDRAFALGSLLPSVLLGVAAGNVARGLPIAPDGEFAGTFVGLLNPFALLVGLLSASMFVVQGGTWLLNKTEGALAERAARATRAGWLAFVVLWLAVTAASRGAAPHLWDAFARQPASWTAPAVLAVAAALVPVAVARRRAGLAFAASSVVVASLMATWGLGSYPALVPSLGDGLARSLTIYNASSSEYTLKAMLVIALLGMPLVVGYTVFIYRSLRGPVVLHEHSY